jgi:hypothetical protein
MNDKYIDQIDPAIVKPYLDWKNGVYKWGDEAYGTHQPLLIHMINETSGNVLEFGMGVYSTPLLHFICHLQGRFMLSLETDKDWFDKFPKYTRMLINPEIQLREYGFMNMNFSVALIDGNPLRFRQTFIEAMKDNVDYFVVHDTEVGEHDELYDYDFSGFKNIYEFKEILPNTCILSNKKIPL